MMEKSKIILGYQDELRGRLQVMEFLEYGYLYEFKTNGVGYIGSVECFRKDTVDFDLFAIHRAIEWRSTFYYEAITDLKRIVASDLPLYVGWGWKSAKYLAYLAGTASLDLRGG